MECSLYELIAPTKQVKAYFDFEYYMKRNVDIQSSHIGANTCLKIFQYLFNYERNNIERTTDHTATALQNLIHCLIYVSMRRFLLSADAPPN